MMALVGPSGCGKSTLLRLIAGLDEPRSGELLMGGRPIAHPAAERGLMFQDPNLFPWLTVRRNIQAGLVARGVLRQRRHEVEEYMRLVGLEGFADAYPHQLSGGMAQRAALARALINHPRLLLLDEPLGALDQFTRMRMQDELLRVWRARRTTMLLVTHDIDEAVYMSDRMLHISATYAAAFCLLACVRSAVTGNPWLVEVAPVTGPMYQLFIFFMVTDPTTTTKRKWSQCAVVALVAVVEMILRLDQELYAPFYALFIVGPITNLIEILWDSRRKVVRPAVAPVAAEQAANANGTTASASADVPGETAIKAGVSGNGSP
jgi:ABC-type nitrate/sulfonate/bicarbonate transport system ATPase subunit